MTSQAIYRLTGLSLWIVLSLCLPVNIILSWMLKGNVDDPIICNLVCHD